MAADLHIHVFAEGEVEEAVFEDFFSGTLGSKYFNLDRNRNRDEEMDSYSIISSLPNVWVGEVSWLKAALFEDNKTFIPDPVGAISEIINEGEEFVKIDDELIAKVKEALGHENKTAYSVTSQQEVIDFLESHKGKLAFTVSW
tara:strand:+ start:33729 stop:34157 length:429 start_codon:yes stop_codon:yes gene_type:complete